MSDAIGCGLLLLLVVAVETALALRIGWLVVWVFAGFGTTIPYWPTVVAVMLVQMVLTSLRGGGKP